MTIKNNKKIQLIILTICFVIFGALLLYANHTHSAEGHPRGTYYERGRVTTVIGEVAEPFPRQLLEVEMRSGEFRGMVVQAESNLLDHTLRAFNEGDRVIVSMSDYAIQIMSPERGNILLFFVALFFILLGVIGGKRGVLSVVGLVFSLTSIAFILVPLTLAGYPPILIAIILGLLIIVVDVSLIAGFNPKSLAAILGCIAGVLVASLFAFIAGRLAFISGYHTEYAGSLMAWGADISLSGIFVSGVIISAMGAITDTSMSIASAMEEMKLAYPEVSPIKLFKAGLNIGRDVMGTMSNTLILAFVGSSFSLILLMASLNLTWIQFINDDGMGIEIIQGVAGSIGIVLTVPLTAFIATKLFSMSKST